MNKPSPETLKAINAELFGGRWRDQDLEQLVTPSFGVVSSFECVLSDLRTIIARDLGHTAPHTMDEADNG